jgi:hypothetical protein
VGERIRIEGVTGDPDKELDFHTFIENEQEHLYTNDNCVACYKGAPFMTSAGACRVKSLRRAAVA